MFNHTMLVHAPSLYRARRVGGLDGVYIVRYRFLEHTNALRRDHGIVARIRAEPFFGRDALRREQRARGLRIRRLRKPELKERNGVRVQKPRIVRKLRKAARSGT